MENRGILLGAAVALAAAAFYAADVKLPPPYATPLPVTIAEGLAHPHLADATVVVPAIIHKGDTAIDCSANQANALIRVLLLSKVVATQADRRNTFARAAKFAIDHVRRLRTAGSGGGLSALCACGRD